MFIDIHLLESIKDDLTSYLHHYNNKMEAVQHADLIIIIQKIERIINYEKC